MIKAARSQWYLSRRAFVIVTGSLVLQLSRTMRTIAAEAQSLDERLDYLRRRLESVERLRQQARGGRS